MAKMIATVSMIPRMSRSLRYHSGGDDEREQRERQKRQREQQKSIGFRQAKEQLCRA